MCFGVRVVSHVREQTLDQSGQEGGATLPVATRFHFFFSL